MSRYHKLSVLSAAVAISFALVGTAHATNGYAPHGNGVKTKGLAGSGSALPQEAMVMAMNPAGIVYVGNRIDAGVAVFSPRREYTVTGDPSGAAPPAFPLYPGTTTSDKEAFLIPSFAMTRMIDEDSAWAIGVYANGGMNTEYPNFSNPLCAGFGGGSGSFCAGGAGVNLEQLFVSPTYARKFSSGKASYGASLILAYQRFEATGLASFGQMSADANNLSDRGVSTSTGVGVRFSVMGEISPGFTASLAYQPEISMSEFDEYAGLFAGGGSFDIPSNWNVGLAWNTSSTSTLTFDIQGIDFSSVDSIGNPISALTTGGNPFGSDAGPGFGWDDMTVFKLGYQWSTGGDWIWRVGVSQGSQPIDSSQVTLNILAPAVMENHYTFGFTKLMGRNNELNFAAMYAPSNSVKGANAFYPLQDVEVEMSQLDLELAYTWKF